MKRPFPNEERAAVAPVCWSSLKRHAQEIPIWSDSRGSSREDLGLILRAIRRFAHMCVNEISGAQSTSGAWTGRVRVSPRKGTTKLLEAAWDQPLPEYERQGCCSVH